MTARYPDYASDILALFEAQDAALTDIDILQPADPFLDMAGEDLRRRVYLTENETGETLCLRPEFTIPVCLDHILKRAATPCRYAYLGEVFRQRRQGGAEFFQAGIEDLGSTDTADADARSLSDAHAILTKVLPHENLVATIGDQAVFAAVLSGLDLPHAWQTRLLRAFGSPGLLEAALSEFSNGQSELALPTQLSQLVEQDAAEPLEDYIHTAMQTMGYSPSAGRHPQDIARRLREKNQLIRMRIPEQTLQALKTFLSLKAPLNEALQSLNVFAAQNDLNLDTALNNFGKRLEHIASYGLPAAIINYDAAFGRPLDYYTGFVFEISSARLDQPLAGGGRYDRMLTLLGAKKPIPGVGFSIWLDRVDSLRSLNS